MSLNGVDLSNNNATAKGDAGIKNNAFVLIKASEGLHTGDADHAHFAATARADKKLLGHYHFGHPLQDATGEADHFLAMAGAKPGEALALDLEAAEGSNSQRLHYALTFLAHVKAKTGVKALIYTYKSYLTGMLSVATAAQAAELRSYPLWIADPSAAKGHPATAGWKTWTIHQYGISGGLDVDVLNGDAKTWAGFSIPQPKPAPAPKPTPAPAPKPVPKPVPQPTPIPPKPLPKPVPKPAPKPVVDLSNVVAARKADLPAKTGHKTHPTDVLIVENGLHAEGLLAKQYVDGSWGSKTDAAFTAFRHKMGYTGSDATGAPGLESLQKLGARHGFTVKG